METSQTTVSPAAPPVTAPTTSHPTSIRADTSLIALDANTALLIYQLRNVTESGATVNSGPAQGCGTTNAADRKKGIWQSCPTARVFAMRITVEPA